MTTTPDVISALAANLTPVRRLRRPVTRAAFWLLLAALIVTLFAISQGLRQDVAQRLQDSVFVARVTGTLLTGVFAAVAAFVLSLPDRSRLWLLLPTPALALWLSDIGHQCQINWVSFGPDGIRPGETARCFATLVLTSLPLSFAMLIMLHYAALLRPMGVVLAGSLAMAAIASTALSLVYDHPDATIMTLIWSLGTAAMFVGLRSAFGRKMFSWVVQRSPPHANTGAE